MDIFRSNIPSASAIPSTIVNNLTQTPCTHLRFSPIFSAFKILNKCSWKSSFCFICSFRFLAIYFMSNLSTDESSGAETQPITNPNTNSTTTAITIPTICAFDGFTIVVFVVLALSLPEVFPLRNGWYAWITFMGNI